MMLNLKESRKQTTYQELNPRSFVKIKRMACLNIFLRLRDSDEYDFHFKVQLGVKTWEFRVRNAQQMPKIISRSPSEIS